MSTAVQPWVGEQNRRAKQWRTFGTKRTRTGYPIKSGEQPHHCHDKKITFPFEKNRLLLPIWNSFVRDREERGAPGLEKTDRCPQLTEAARTR